MKYLITGVGGFIGKAIYNKLIEKKEQDDTIVGIDRRSPYSFENHPQGTTDHFICNCQLDSDMWVKRLLSSYKPDVIFHFAGCATVSSPAQKIWKSNVDTTFNLLDTISRLDYKKPPKFILASSINAAYNQSPYSASKLAAEALVNAYNYQEHVIGMPLRFCAVAGAHNTHGAVRDIIKKILTADNPEVFGNYPGSQKPFLFVDNLVDIILDITENLNTVNCLRWPAITIGPHDNVSIADIIEIVKKYTNKTVDVKFNGQGWKGDMQYVSTPYDNSLSRYSKYRPLQSYKAVEAAVVQTLKEEYSEYWNSL